MGNTGCRHRHHPIAADGSDVADQALQQQERAAPLQERHLQTEAKASAKLMKGHYWEYMKMLLSFVPWIIFSIFTLYLALIWLVPYIETCMAVFYRNISGEFDEPPEEPYPPVTPIPQFHDETEA